MPADIPIFYVGDVDHIANADSTGTLCGMRFSKEPPALPDGHWCGRLDDPRCTFNCEGCLAAVGVPRVSRLATYQELFICARVEVIEDVTDMRGGEEWRTVRVRALESSFGVDADTEWLADHMTARQGLAGWTLIYDNEVSRAGSTRQDQASSAARV